MTVEKSTEAQPQKKKGTGAMGWTIAILLLISALLVWGYELNEAYFKK